MVFKMKGFSPFTQSTEYEKTKKAISERHARDKVNQANEGAYFDALKKKVNDGTATKDNISEYNRLKAIETRAEKKD